MTVRHSVNCGATILFGNPIDGPSDLPDASRPQANNFQKLSLAEHNLCGYFRLMVDSEMRITSSRQEPISFPSPLLNIISEALNRASALYLALKPDQHFGRVCYFHRSRPVRKNPAPDGDQRARPIKSSPLLEKQLGV
jgi:hypothetical protein